MALTNTQNLDLMQGDDFVHKFYIKDSGGLAVDLTGYTARLRVYKKYSSTTASIDASTSNGKITIDALTGLVSWTIADTDTAAIRIPDDEDTIECVYDLEIVDSGGLVNTPARGTVTIYRQVG